MPAIPIAESGFAITPADGSNLASVAFGVYVGGAGTLKFDTPWATGISLAAVAAGAVVPVKVTKVYATGTTATGLLGLTN